MPTYEDTFSWKYSGEADAYQFLNAYSQNLFWFDQWQLQERALAEAQLNVVNSGYTLEEGAGALQPFYDALAGAKAAYEVANEQYNFWTVELFG